MSENQPMSAENDAPDEAPCERYKGVRPGPCVFCGHPKAAHAENDEGILAPRCPHCGWQAIDREDAPENYEAAKADVVEHKAKCPASTHPAEKDAPCEHAWEYSNTPGVNICTTCGDLRDWPKGTD